MVKVEQIQPRCRRGQLTKDLYSEYMNDSFLFNLEIN